MATTSSLGELEEAFVANRFVVGFDELGLFFEDADVEHTRLSRGGEDRAEVLAVRLPGLTLDVGVYSWDVISRGATSSKHTTLITSDPQSGASFNGVPGGRGIVRAYGPNSELVGTGPGGARFFVLSIETEELEAAAQALERDFTPMGVGEVATRSGPEVEYLQELASLFTKKMCRFGSSRLTAPLAKRFRDEAVASSLSVISGDGDSMARAPMSRQTALEIVSDCDDYAQGCHYRGITSLDLSREAFASERRVRYAFEEITGVSPMRFMRSRALNEVRKELRTRGASSVTDAAFVWGFTEMGRFAREYRDLFGELPSETVRSSKCYFEEASGRLL